MKITILCSDERHPINGRLRTWIDDNSSSHDIVLLRKTSNLGGGDILFLISCDEFIAADDRALYEKVLVIHASALPLGRGWSPHIWQILNGATELALTLLEASDSIDSGGIWTQLNVDVPETALWDEINERLFAAELQLMDFAVKHFYTIKPHAQDTSVKPTYYERRMLQDSQLDVGKSVASQFDLLRVCDPVRYPAHFELRGKRYKIFLERFDD